MTMNVGKEVAALKRMGVTGAESASEREGSSIPQWPPSNCGDVFLAQIVFESLY